MGNKPCKQAPKGESEVIGGTSPAEQLLEIPGTKVVIIGKDGEEGAVEEGSFKFLEVKQPNAVKLLYVGPSLDDPTRGFYFPLDKNTAVVLSEGRVITMDAGDGDAYGICLPPDIDDTTLQVLDELLWGATAFTNRSNPRSELERKIAKVKAGGQVFIEAVRAIEAGVSEAIQTAAEMADQKLAEHKTSLPMTAKGVNAAKGVTRKVVKVSDTVIGGIVGVAAQTAKITTTTAIQAAKSIAPAGEANGPTPIGDTIEIGKAHAVVAIEVLEALMVAGDRLYAEATTTTEKVATQKYGEDVAKMTKDGMKVGKDVFDIYKITGSGGGSKAAKLAIKKQLAKKAMMHTAKGVAMGAKESMLD